MSDQDDGDLSAAFEGLRAPRSTANYADRVPSVEAVETVYARRWPQALATVLAVLVALGGAGTFLALRNARQGGVGSSAGYPSARTNAAMAFDSSSGLTVMYGGLSASGSSLADTWTWNGSSWATSTGSSPGKLLNAHMSDDPPDGGVLLTGVPPPANKGSGIACAVGGSGSGGVTGTATGSTGSLSPSTPGAAGGAPPLNQPPTKSGVPAAATPPPVASTSPITACPAVVPYPTLQTWLFTARGWTHVAGSTSAAVNADTPSAASQLAYDSSSGQVIAVSSSPFAYCGLPLRAGAAVQPDLMCPMTKSGQNGAPCSPSACASMPCRLGAAVNSCLPFAGSISTWTWSHGQWTQRKGAIIPGAATGVAFGDAAGAHTTLVTETASVPFCGQPETCATALTTTSVYTWAGSAWSQAATAGSVPSGLSLGGASAASIGSRAIVLTASGELYSFSAADAHWVRQATASPDGRTGAAMADGPGGSIVLFGGTSIGKVGSALIGIRGSVASDTWTWNGSTWRHVAGPSPAPVTTPPPCSDVTGLGSNACASPPARLPQVSAPSSAPAGSPVPVVP
ncbi:MAG: hypothetical protein ABI352_10950 [Candidatus Dormibacter sp.]